MSACALTVWGSKNSFSMNESNVKWRGSQSPPLAKNVLMASVLESQISAAPPESWPSTVWRSRERTGCPSHGNRGECRAIVDSLEVVRPSNRTRIVARAVRRHRCCIGLGFLRTKGVPQAMEPHAEMRVGTPTVEIARCHLQPPTVGVFLANRTSQHRLCGKSKKRPSGSTDSYRPVSRHNGRVHRAAANSIDFKTRATRGSVCNPLLSDNETIDHPSDGRQNDCHDD